MRDRLTLGIFLIGAGVLLYAGRGLLARSTLEIWGLTFGGTTAAAVLGMALYRVQHELRASRHELAREQAEISFAREVQRSLFPRRLPVGQGLEFSGVCVPARGISGDYYDVMSFAGGRLVFVVADISGKGISAAILMSNVHAVLRILAEAGHSPAEVCRQLNSHLYRITEAYRFATMFYAEWNQEENRLCYVNAGHPVPILRDSGGCRRLHLGSLPLGLFPSPQFEMGHVRLDPGDTIVLYSDGITEAGIDHGEQFGDSRLEAVVSRWSGDGLPELQRQVLAEVESWAGTKHHDDMTLLLVRNTAGLEGAS